MKHILLSILFILSPLFFSQAGAQTMPLDSLCEQIGECLDDVARLEEGRQLLEEALSRQGVSQETAYPQLLYLHSYYYINTGDFAKAKEQLLQLMPLLPADCNAELSISTPQDLGVCYRRENQNDSALYYYDQALQAARQQEDLEWQATISLNIGVLYGNLKRHEEAEKYMEQAVAQVRQIDDPYTELCALQLTASEKIFLHKFEEARTYIEPAYQLALQSESADWQLRCLTSMVAVYDFLQMADSVAVSLQRGNALLAQVPARGITAIGYITARGNYYYNHQQWQQAASDLQAVYDSEMSGVRTIEMYEHLGRCYEQLGQWQLACAYKDSTTACANRMAEEKFSAQLAEFNARYQTMEKDLEITRLQAQRTKIIIMAISAIVVLGMLIIAIWMWLHGRRLRREARQRITTLEQERSRIARELHDGLCNDLLALEMKCATGSSHAETTASLRQLRQQARTLSHQLMPPEFTHLSLQDLLQHLAQSIDAPSCTAVFRTTDNDTEEKPGQAEFSRLSSETAHELYRIAQEHTANIVKGGSATHIEIILSPKGLTISDDGQADTIGTAQQGIGQRTLKDRATAIGATISQHHHDGQNILLIEL